MDRTQSGPKIHTRFVRYHFTHYLAFYEYRAKTFFPDLEAKYEIKFKFEDDRTGIDITITGENESNVESCYNRYFILARHIVKYDQDIFHFYTKIKRVTMVEYDQESIFETGLNITSVEWSNKKRPHVACLVHQSYGELEFISCNGRPFLEEFSAVYRVVLPKNR